MRFALWLLTVSAMALVLTVPRAAAAPVAEDLATLLGQVVIVDRIDVVAGYDRKCGRSAGCVFGPAWNDPTSHTGCDVRNTLLAMSLRDVKYKDGTRNCKVIAGTLDPDPYTGQAVDLKSVEVDHIYPERRAWDAGAWKWDPVRRQIFANDLTELAAVSRQANRAKSDSGLDTWLPNYQPCRYVLRYLAVAVKYQLPITDGERTAATNACNGIG